MTLLASTWQDKSATTSTKDRTDGDTKEQRQENKEDSKQRRAPKPGSQIDSPAQQPLSGPPQATRYYIMIPSAPGLCYFLTDQLSSPNTSTLPLQYRFSNTI